MSIQKCTYFPCEGDITSDGDCDTCGRAYNPNPTLAKGKITKKKATTNRTSRRLSVRVTTLRSVQEGTTTAKAVRKPRSASTHSTRGGMGAGLIEIAVVPPVLPDNLLKPELYTPPELRICKNCLSRGITTKLGLDCGFCKNCRTPYEFEISPGVTISDRYLIQGIIAEGGLGRIYIGRDERLERTVVLKSMKARDKQAIEDVRRERQALSKAHHPGIVDVVDFIKWGPPKNETDHIVMEFCGGKTFQTIMEEDGGKIAPAKALALIYSLLPAFEALHEEHNLLYMDAKPRNFMVVGNQGKVLDLGACRLIDDPARSFLCTPGYDGPEIVETPDHKMQMPGKTFDIFTLGRTLMEMILGDDFDWEGDEYRYAMPPRDESDILSENEPLYRLLRWMTNPDPDDRPQTISEVMEAVYGVLFKTVCYEAKKAGNAHSQRFVSHLFAADHFDPETKPGFALLPALLINPDAKEWREVQAALTSNETDKQLRELRKIISARRNALEAKLWLAWLLTDGEEAEADKILHELIEEDPFDPRFAYALGRLRLAQNRPKEAFELMNAAYTPLCGELATEFALALTAEVAGDWQTAELMYSLVITADPSFTSACFGAARARLALNDRAGAINALDTVPSGLDSYAAAMSTKVEVLTDTTTSAPTIDNLLAASNAIEAGHFGGINLHKLRATVFAAGVFNHQQPGQTGGGASKSATATLLCGVAFDLKPLRAALETEYRLCAKLAVADSRETSWNYVRLANEAGNRRAF